MHNCYKLFILLVIFISFLPDNSDARMIAVVYDDSGSMKEADKWIYANYAMQTLAALLSKEDKLIVLRMSKPNYAEDINLTRLNRDINKIRTSFTPVGDTPYGAVQKAMEVLYRSQDSDKWLIIITDGSFNNFEKIRTLPESVVNEISVFVQKTGSRSIFLLIGQQADQLIVHEWEKNAQTSVIKADSLQDIVGNLQEIAAAITSRTLSNRGLSTETKGNTVTLKTEFPLRRLTVFEQKEYRDQLTKLKEAKTASETFNIQEVLDAEMPKGSAQLFGRVSHIMKNNNQVIPTGELDLVFDKTVDFNKIKFLPEVAVRFEIIIQNSSGKELKGGIVHKLCSGEEIKITAKLVSPEDGKSVIGNIQNISELKVKAIIGSMEYPMSIDHSQEFFKKEIKLPIGRHTVSASAEFPGYFNFRSNIISLDMEECIPRKIELKGSDTWTALVTEIDKAKPLTIAPKADRNNVSSDEFKQAWTIKLIGDPKIKIDIKKKNTHWEAQPKTYWGCPCLTPTGHIPVTFEAINTANPKESVIKTFDINIENVSWWRKCGPLVLKVLGTIFFIWYLFGIIKKPRFGRGRTIEYQRIQHSVKHRPNTIPLKSSFVKRWLIPYKPESMVVEELKFHAGVQDNHIILNKNQIREGMIIEGIQIEKEEVGVKDKRIKTNNKIEVVKGNNREIYKYL